MKKIWLMLPFLLFFSGCADLTEQVFDEVQVEDVEALLDEASPEFLNNLVASVYAQLIPNFSERLFFNLQESTSDISMTPTRLWQDPSRSDWFDGGRYVKLHTHTWDPSEPTLNDVWNNLQGGIAAALEVLDAFDTPKALGNSAITPLRAEVQGLLAFYMWATFDLYAQVPYINLETGENVVLTGQEAMDEMESLLDAAIPNLNDKNSSESGARFNRAAARTLLARIYLNKGVYLDRYASSFNFSSSDMDKVIAETTNIIDQEGYSLATDYFRLFDGDSDDNSATDELIFVVNLIAGQTGNRAFTAMVMSQGQYAADGGSFRGWNGFCTLPEFVDSWDTNDPRFFEENYPNEPGVIDPATYQLNRGIQVGVQHGPVPVDDNGNPTEGGTFKRDANGMLVIEVLRNFLRDNQVVDYSKDVSLTSNQWAGARVFKYEYDTPGPGRWDTDINPVLLRLADVYLMRAEAKLRNGDNAGALADVNAVRTARGAAELSSLDMDAMLDERGFEFYWESHRRTDLIRFGKFNDAWTSKDASDANKRVFPIPLNALAASSNLTQNDGY
ncbi:MAG: RagB/SusD family nutrient uptake outer membrane protein [Bacteroidia bacterium]|nr:RagB/SusD family nutrient uptake outer membrane protein [Bacteroidia bacterium]